MIYKVLIVPLLFLSTFKSFSQNFYRFKAEISVKEKKANGKYGLTMGNVYYDKIYKKIVYKLNFPDKEDMVIQDTSMFRIDRATQKLKSRSSTLLIPEFTVFHMALTGRLSDYGLTSKNDEPKIYKIKSTEKTPQGVKVVWTPSIEKLKKDIGDIHMLKKDRRLAVMVFYDKDNKIISRQFFKKYVNVKGIEFPTEITFISYSNTGEQNIQQTTYKNIVIDQQNEDEIYRYKIPITKPVSKFKK